MLHSRSSQNFQDKDCRHRCYLFTRPIAIVENTNNKTKKKKKKVQLECVGIYINTDKLEHTPQIISQHCSTKKKWRTLIFDSSQFPPAVLLPMSRSLWRNKAQIPSNLDICFLWHILTHFYSLRLSTRPFISKGRAGSMQKQRTETLTQHCFSGRVVSLRLCIICEKWISEAMPIR